MANTGFVLCGTGANVDRAANNAWATPTNVQADDATTSSATTPTDYLVCTNFNFSAIPDGSTILGVQVRWQGHETGTGSSNYTAQLISNATPTLLGSTKTSGTINGTTPTNYDTGATNDVWGASLTAAIVKNSGFGAAIWSTDTTNVLVADVVWIAIEYSPPLLPGVVEWPEQMFRAKFYAPDVLHNSTIRQVAAVVGETNQFRVPLYAPLFRRLQAGICDVGQSLVLTTLAVVAATAPFVPEESGYAVERIYSASTEQIGANYRLLAATVASAPFVTEETAQLVERRYAPTEAIDVGIMVRDITAPITPTHPPSYWQRRSVSQLEQNSANYRLLTGVAAALPFVPYDFPDVEFRRETLQHESYGYLPKVLVPIGADGLADAFGRKEFYAPDAYQNNTLRQVAPSVPLPIGQGEFPDIAARLDFYAPDVLHNNTLRQVAPAITAPFVPAQFPNPIRRSYVATDDNEGGIAIRDIPPPNWQTDWPNPQRYRYAPQVDMWQMSVALRTLVILPPFTPAEFPNPRRKTSAYWTDTPNLLPGLFSVQTRPFKLHDWQLVPTRRKWAQADCYASNWLVLQGIVPPPAFLALDFQNPPRARQPFFDVVENNTLRQVAPPPVHPVDLTVTWGKRRYFASDILPNTTTRQIPPLPPLYPTDLGTPMPGPKRQAVEHLVYQFAFQMQHAIPSGENRILFEAIFEQSIFEAKGGADIYDAVFEESRFDA